MPLPAMKGRRAYYFDKELELRDGSAAAALDGTEASTGVEFAVRFFDVAKVVIDHGAITGTLNEDNNWTVNVQVSDVVGGTYTTIATTGLLGAAATQIEVPISGLAAAVKDPDSAFIRVQAVKAGTIGDLSYGAYISPTP